MSPTERTSPPGPVLTVVDDARWDGFLAATPGGDHVQSSGWARTKGFQGFGNTRVVLAREGSIVAGAQILIRRFPVAGALGYVPRGPVVAPGDTAAADAVIAALTRRAAQHRIRHLVVQPGRNGEWIAARLHAGGFVPGAMSVAPTATLLVDLGPDLDDIFAGLSKSARKHVRRGLRHGVAVREGTAADLGVFHDLVTATARRHGFSPYPRGYFEAMWQAFHPAGHLRLFFADYEGAALSGHMVIPFGETLLSKVVAWSGTHPTVYPNEVLEWHVIEWAKQHGFAYYDLEGVERPTAERILAGAPDPIEDLRPADAFKLKFGGSPVLLPAAFDYFSSRLVAHTYGRAYRMAFSGGWPRASLSRWRTRPAQEIDG